MAAGRRRFAKLAAFFGTSRLDQITAWDVQRYKAQSAVGVQKATTNREVAILRRMFNLAIQWEKAKKNPARGEGVMYPEPERSIYPLSAVDQVALVAACSAHLRPIVVTALNTGLRKGELLALAWSDVHLVRGVLEPSGSRKAVVCATCRSMTRCWEHSAGSTDRNRAQCSDSRASPFGTTSTDRSPARGARPDSRAWCSASTGADRCGRASMI